MKSITSPLQAAMLFICTLLWIYSAAQGNKSSRILFIYMRLKDNVLTLEKTKIVNGKLKDRRVDKDGDLYFEITADNSKALLSRLINKPGKIHYDYIDADGQLKGGITEQPEDLFVVRVPFDETMKNISFYATKPRTGNMLGKVRSAADVKDILIARFPLHFTTDGQQ